MILRHKAPSDAAVSLYEADRELAGQFDELLAGARQAEQQLRDARAAHASREELHQLGLRLDEKLTAVMRAGFAAQRATIGARGYDDRIYRRQSMATPPVHAWTREAQRLLTLRERHRLTGIVKLPRTRMPVRQESGAHGLH